MKLTLRSPKSRPCRGALAVVLLAATACSWRAGPAVPYQSEEPAAGRADLYVSPYGDDHASGESPGNALRTIQRALQLVTSGQRVLILPGTYHETILLQEYGDPDAPITISGLPGQTILDGRRQLPVALWCEGCRGLVLEGLTVQGYSDAGLVILYSEKVVLRELLVSDSGFNPQVADWEFEGYGIDVESSSGIVIERSQVTRIGPNPQRPGRMMGSSIVAYDCRDCVIRGNTVFENTGGMVIEDSVGVLVQDNLLFDNDLDATAERWWDGAIWLDGGRDITLRGNIIRDNLGPGLQISDEESAGPTGYVLEGNWVTGNRIGLHLWGFGTWELPGEPTLLVSGNRISGNHLGDVFVSPGWCLPPEPCEPES